MRPASGGSPSYSHTRNRNCAWSSTAGISMLFQMRPPDRQDSPSIRAFLRHQADQKNGARRKERRIGRSECTRGLLAEGALRFIQPELHGRLRRGSYGKRVKPPSAPPAPEWPDYGPGAGGAEPSEKVRSPSVNSGNGSIPDASTRRRTLAMTVTWPARSNRSVRGANVSPCTRSVHGCAWPFPAKG